MYIRLSLTILSSRSEQFSIQPRRQNWCVFVRCDDHSRSPLSKLGKLKIKGRPPARIATGRPARRARPRVNQKANAAKLVIIYSIYA